MSWAEHHRRSETLAANAETAAREGKVASAEVLYAEAAKSEVEALAELDPAKERTYGITAVSAASLYYKGRDFQSAEGFVLTCLNRPSLQTFAREQLKTLLQKIWGEVTIAATGLKFSKRDVLVSVKGGEIVTGGAPLDLILRKVEEVRAIFYRTVEMLMNRTFRVRGGPPIDIQRGFRPWLFHAPPGSYQFAVRLESSEQLEFPAFGGQALPQVEAVTSKFLEIVAAAATDPEQELPKIVPDPEYRGAFLKLTRSLAPTGKGYDSLDIRSADDQSTPAISFALGTRKALSDSIKKGRRVDGEAPADENVQLRGILRAVHLDQDWLEVTILKEGHEEHVKVTKAGEAIDDIVGPMINRPVLVDATLSPGGKHTFVDIEAIE